MHKHVPFCFHFKRFSATPARAGDCPFFCEKKGAQRSGKGTALVPFQTPTKFRYRKQRGTTALVNSLREFVRGGSVSLQQACPKQSAPLPPLNFPLPLCKRWLGIIFSVAWARFRLTGNEESFLLFYSWRIHKGPSRSLMRIFAYFLFGRK